MNVDIDDNAANGVDTFDNTSRNSLSDVDGHRHKIYHNGGNNVHVGQNSRLDDVVDDEDDDDEADEDDDDDDDDDDSDGLSVLHMSRAWSRSWT